jgi:single-stranded DNA-binding protein
MNAFTCTGFARKDPDVRLANGKRVAVFPVEVENETNSGRSTFDVVVLDSLADYAEQHVRTNRQIFINGRIQRTGGSVSLHARTLRVIL